YAPYTLVRGAIEADAWACWLLDTQLTPRERLARALTIRAFSLRELYRLGETRQDSERIKQVSDVANKHRLDAHRNKLGELDRDVEWSNAGGLGAIARSQRRKPP